MNALAPVVPKIAKLIPRLGTDSDGECVATVRAIERTLKSAGLDLHDLAKIVEQYAGDRSSPEHGFDTGPPPMWAEMNTCARRAWLCALLRKAEQLSAWEETFVRDIAAKTSFSGFSTSPKQSSTLTQIIAKAWAWGVRA